MAKAIPLDDLEVPAWFANAAEDLKPVRPRWLKEPLPTIALQGGGEVPSEASPWMLGAIAFTEAESAKHDLVDLLKRQASSAALDAWVAAVLKIWVAAGTPAKDAWVLTGAALLGGDTTVRSLHDTVRKWCKDKDRTLAIRGVDALGRIGTKAALEEVATLSAGIRDHSVADDAQQLIGRKAKAQGATRDEIEDRYVSDCGLDAKGERVLSYGPRTFRAVLEKNLEVALVSEDGRKRISLPPPAATDDRVQAEASRAAWTEMKTGIKRVVKAQLKRLEQGMITGRKWSSPEFQVHILQHTIVSRIARLLVWQTDGDPPQSLRVTEDLTLANAADEIVPLDATHNLRVAHPLRLSPAEFEAWGEIFSDYRIMQPFQQLARAAHRCDPSLDAQQSLAAPPHVPLKAGVLYGILDNDGWRLGRSVDGRLTCSWKSFVADSVTATISYSGMFVGDIARSPDQTITHCRFYSGITTPEEKDVTGAPLRLGLVPAVAFSETMRRLMRLTAAGS